MIDRSICLSICQSVYLSIWLSVYLPICLPLTLTLILTLTHSLSRLSRLSLVSLVSLSLSFSVCIHMVNGTPRTNIIGIRPLTIKAFINCNEGILQTQIRIAVNIRACQYLYIDIFIILYPYLYIYTIYII